MSDKVFSIFLILYALRDVNGHGRLVSPPGRSSMWKYGFDTPKNYNDNQLYCGGFGHQKEHNGACGLCGDPVDGPLENEAGGKYATDKIAKCISTSETTLDVAVELTANHKGYFEFKLCENNNYKKKFTQECLDKHPLKVRETGDVRYYPAKKEFHNFTLELPQGLTCDQCVLQWRYHTGNSWGKDENGTKCLGCGLQEEFYACSDIKISDTCKVSTKSPTQTTTKFKVTSAKPSTTTTQSTTTKATTENLTPSPIKTSISTALPSVNPSTKSKLPSTSKLDISSVKPSAITKLSSILSTRTVTPSVKPITSTKITPTTTSIIISSKSKSVTSIQKPTVDFVTTSTASIPPATSGTFSSSKYITQSTPLVTKQSTAVKSSAHLTTPFSTKIKQTTSRTTPTPSTTMKYREKEIKNCVPTDLYNEYPEMTKWCMHNCNLGFCPQTHCRCKDSVEMKVPVLVCKSTLAYAAVPGMDSWCQTNCPSPSGCPLTHCNCVMSN